MGRINEDWLQAQLDDHEQTLYSQAYGLPEIVDFTTTEHGPTTGVETLPAWDLPKKIGITAAPVGAFISKRQNKHHPIVPADIRDQLRKAIEAGASGVHVHVRNPETGKNVIDEELFDQVLDPIQRDYPNVVYDGSTIPAENGDWAAVERIYDRGLFDMTPVNPYAAYHGDTVIYEPPDELLARVRLAIENDVKPTIAVVTDADVHTAKRYLIDTEELEEPYVWHVFVGMPGATYTPTPAALADSLTSQISRIREIDGQHRVVICAAGRAASYSATLGILLGCHIRIGTEDTVFKYPHKDTRIEDNGAEVERFETIAELLGREIATGAEFADILGIG